MHEFYVDANTWNFSVALSLQCVPLLIGGCEAAKDSGAVKGGKKCNGVIHRASSALTVMIKNFAVRFYWLTN